MSARTTGAAEPKLRRDIQGMRALAVLGVVLYHAGVPFVGGGFVGVDVFFVISGFLITLQLVESTRRGERPRLREFYARRARRLLPMSALVTALTVIGSWVWLDQIRAQDATTDALWTTFFGLNIRLADQGVQYMGADTLPSPLQHYWSLAVEEQFYLVWPLLLTLLTASWWRGRAGRRRPDGAVPWPAMAGLLAIVVASYLWCIEQTSVAQDLAYFLTPARAWELGVGALVALLVGPCRALPRPVAAALSWAGVLGVLTSMTLLSDATTFPGAIAAWPVLAAAAVAAGGAGGTAATDVLFGSRPVQWLGDISYSWYLWHWPVLVLLPAFVDREPTLVDTAVAVALSLWLAGASHMVLEDPVRFLPALRRPAASAALALGCTSVVAAAAVAAPVLSDDAVLGKNASTYRVTTQADLTAALGRAARIGSLPRNLTPSVERLGDDAPAVDWPDGHSCMVGLEATAALNSCRVTARGGTPVVLSGDSHAFQWLPAVRRIAEKRGWTLYVLAKSGCPLYDTTLYSTDFKRDYTECDSWRESALNRIERIDPALVITSAFVASDRGAEYRARWNDGVRSTVSRLTKPGTRVVALMDTPWPNEQMDSCLAAHPREVDACAPSPVQSYRDNTRHRDTATLARAAGARVIDPTPWFCTEFACPVVVGNTPVYHDQTHMSATWARALTPLLDAALPKLRHARTPS